ncbi:MAG: glycosyltransferase family 4 protein [Elusimicrobiales bacterium]|nr:glycosyltransferase family 4 protein [Elusimicrobiales bacterium]
MRILFLLQDFPYPPATGMNRKVYGVLSCLASKGWKCDVLCFGGPAAAARIPAFEAAVPGVKVLSVVPPPSGIAASFKKLLCLVRGLPPSLGGFSSGRFRAALQKAGADGSYNAVHYDVINMAQYLPWGPRVPSVLSANDAISLFYERMIKETPGVLRRLYLSLAKYLIARFEARVYPEFDKVHVVSAEDSAHLKELCPGLDVEIIPIAANGAFTDYAPSLSRLANSVPRVVFTGNLDVPGIANGLFGFLDDGYGTVASAALFEFYVLGPKASPEDEKRISGFPGTKYFRWVEDYEAFLASSDIVLILDRSGAPGIKTRTLDAMSLGKPVIGTTIVFSGIDAENGKNCFVCDGPAQASAALKRLLSDKALSETAGKAARELMLSRYSARVVGPKWEALYAGLGKTS